jgi:hypothetical protein
MIFLLALPALPWTARSDPISLGALVSMTNTTFNGNNITIDSYDSRDPLHSDWQTNYTYRGASFGAYPLYDGMAGVMDTNNPAEIYKRKDNAVVATDGNSIVVQNANIAGYIDTAPGGVASFNGGGYVGDVAWVFAANGTSPGNAYQAVELGHSKDDMNTVFPDVQLPTGVTWTGVTESGNHKNATVFSSSGYYKLISNGGAGIAVADPIIINATNAVIWLPNGLSYLGNTNGAIMLGPNADVTFYVDGSFTLWRPDLHQQRRRYHQLQLQRFRFAACRMGRFPTGLCPLWPSGLLQHKLGRQCKHHRLCLCAASQPDDECRRQRSP